MKYVLSLDQGTTSSRAILFDRSGTIVDVAQKEFTQHYPQPGWVEHDAMEIWETQLEVTQEVLRRVGSDGSDVAAIGITNQRETTVVWDRRTGLPISNAIVWQDRRTAGFCDELKERGLEDEIRSRSGLVVDAYFSGTKVRWILDNVAGAREAAAEGHLAFGTIDSWLIWNLTGGSVHATDPSNASRTMLYNINDLTWDDVLLDLLDVPSSVLPAVRPSSGVVGTCEQALFGSEIPIAGIAGDQQAALFGQVCVDPGMVKNTYGTGCFMLMNTGTSAIESQNNLLTTIAWQIGNETTYALEGSVFIGGAVVQWLRDGLGIIQTSSEVEQLAETVDSSEGVFLVPAFAGLGAPHWDPYARGTLIGLTRGSSAAHIARAALDSIAFQSADLVRAMETDSGIELASMRVDGGAAANNILMQFQTDLLNVSVVRPRIVETTAQGAAYLAGLAVGFWSGISELKTLWEEERTFLPQMSGEERDALTMMWKRALDRSRDWIDSDKNT
ncbi:MAG: glycerol kinase GlpK [Rhodothermales bacterium]